MVDCVLEWESESEKVREEEIKIMRKKWLLGTNYDRRELPSCIEHKMIQQQYYGDSTSTLILVSRRRGCKNQ